MTDTAKIGIKKSKEVAEAVANNDKCNSLMKMYTIDSIVKTVGGDYIQLFDSIIKDKFVDSFKRCNCEEKEKLFTLRRSWENVFPLSTLSSIDNAVNQLDKNWPVRQIFFLSSKISINPMEI